VYAQILCYLIKVTSLLPHRRVLQYSIWIDRPSQLSNKQVFLPWNPVFLIWTASSCFFGLLTVLVLFLVTYNTIPLTKQVIKKRDLFWLTVLVQGWGAAYGDSPLAGRILGWCMMSLQETGSLHVCVPYLVSLLFLIKPWFNHGRPTLITLSNSNHFPEALPLNTLVN
jgi:hypothetical protein